MTATDPTPQSGPQAVRSRELRQSGGRTSGVAGVEARHADLPAGRGVDAGALAAARERRRGSGRAGCHFQDS